MLMDCDFETNHEEEPLLNLASDAPSANIGSTIKTRWGNSSLIFEINGRMLALNDSWGIDKVISHWAFFGVQHLDTLEWQ